MSDYRYQDTHDSNLIASIHVGAIVKVIGFDAKKMTVDVQPISKSVANGEPEVLPPILSVPMAATRSGGFVFKMQASVGDVGVVLFMDHDIDSVIATGKETTPLTTRMHAMDDAVYIGGVVTGIYEVNNLPEESTAIASEDGNIFIAVTKDKVLVKNGAGTSAEFTADAINMNAKDITIKAENAVRIKGATVETK